MNSKPTDDLTVHIPKKYKHGLEKRFTGKGNHIVRYDNMAKLAATLSWDKFRHLSNLKRKYRHRQKPIKVNPTPCELCEDYKTTHQCATECPFSKFHKLRNIPVVGCRAWMDELADVRAADIEIQINCLILFGDKAVEILEDLRNKAKNFIIWTE